MINVYNRDDFTELQYNVTSDKNVFAKNPAYTMISTECRDWKWDSNPAVRVL